MVGPAYDCFRNPLGAVRFQFEKSGGSPDASRGDWGVRDLFSKVLFEDGALKQAPEINSVPLHAIPTNSLVRFRGMVQDMFNVEYYIGAYKDSNSTWRTNKYTDAAQMTHCNEADMQIWDRRPLYCVPVPGENAWVKEMFATPKDAFPNWHGSDHDMRSAPKRQREDAEVDTEVMETDDSVAEPAEDKRVRVDNSNDNHDASQSNAPLDLNMPLGEKNLLPCLVKVYDGQDSDLKLNDIVEFIGVLTYDPELTVHSTKNGSDEVQSAFMEDDVSSHLPASKVPRLHCILLRKLSREGLFSAMPNSQSLNTNISELRSSLVNKFTEILGGDGLASEYLLLHLLSRVHARVEPIAVGKLSLNLMDSMSSSESASAMLASRIYKAMSMLLPRSYMMSLSLDYLNKKLIAPRKDYKTNRLTTGDLQLADETHLMLNEIDMKAGLLTEIGLQNVHYLKNLMEWQKLEYDFEFYKMEMPTDLPVLVFSGAKSRLFPTEVVVPIRRTRQSLFDLPEAQLHQWRMYLGAAKAADHSIDPSMQKVLEEDLVSARQEDRTLGPEVFHRWLTLGRLLSLSFGESTLTPERWRMVRDLERRLTERLRSC